jgi:hypothetical protein
MPAVSVVVPALNEARNIPYIFARIPANLYEVILVDGWSVDATVAIARRLRSDVQVVARTCEGEGNALAYGSMAAAGDIIAMFDADDSAGGGSNDLTRLRSSGNYALTAFINGYYGRSYSDLCYGFNVFWRRYVPILGLDATSPSPPKGSGRLWGDGFEVETLIHVRAAKVGPVVAKVPSLEYPRIHGSSSLNSFADGLRVLRAILTVRRRIWSSLAIEASPLPLSKLPGKAADVSHETPAMPAATAAGLEQRATEGAGGLEAPQVRGASCPTSTDQPRPKRSCPLRKFQRLGARSVHVPTADHEPQEQVIAASNTNRHRKSLIVTSISPKRQQTWRIPARLLSGCYVHAIATRCMRRRWQLGCAGCTSGEQKGGGIVCCPTV